LPLLRPRQAKQPFATLPDLVYRPIRLFFWQIEYPPAFPYLDRQELEPYLAGLRNIYAARRDSPSLILPSSRAAQSCPTFLPGFLHFFYIIGASMNSLSWKCLAVLALALVVGGCGESGPRLYKAGGTVTYKNAPVEGAQVTFAYEDGEFASGSTDKDGKFQLAYKGKPGGAALGKCKVTVIKVAGPKINAGAAALNNAPPKGPEDMKAKADAMKKAAEDLMAAKAAEAAAGGPQALIPKKYSDPSTSGFAFEIVTDESKNNFPLDLKD
jgi:hypothetical protein